MQREARARATLPIVRRRWWAPAICVVLAGLIARPAARLWKAERILEHVSQFGTGAPPSAAIDTEEETVAGHLGMFRARLYRSGPAGPRPGVVVVHGVHFRGIDEPRLVAFSHALADAGFVVLTPELPDLGEYRITPDDIDRIAESVRWLAARPDRVDSHRVGLLGFSFAGGLSLLAAGDVDVVPHLAWVTSVGGHQDLARVLRFFVENRVESPRGVTERKAHEYGLAVLAYRYLDRLVPEADREIMRRALRAWLHEDREVARIWAKSLTSPEAERLFARFESHRLGELGGDLEALVREDAHDLERLSPHGKLHRILCPVYLLHGADDSVIPSSETDWADLELGAREHRALVSPLLEHVEVSHEASFFEMFELVDFVSRLVG
jgi:dienelactone hydrolase